MIPIGDEEKISGTPWVNISLVFLNIGVFIYIYFFSGAPIHIIQKFGFVPAHFFSFGWSPTIDPLKYATLVTANFLHADYMHITGNMLFLAVFGDNVEARLGRFRYLVFYILCGIIAMLVQGYSSKGSTLIVIGASGAIACLLYTSPSPRDS